MLPETIQTTRATLRPFRSSDVAPMHTYLQDDRMARFLETGDGPLTLAGTEAIIAAHQRIDREKRNVWAVTIDDEIVGAASINFAKQCRVAEIGYSIKPVLWNQGYGTEVAGGVVDTAFANLPQLIRIQANIHPENVASIEVGKRLGMRLEGTLRSYAFVRGLPADEAIYAILRDEWLARH